MRNAFAAALYDAATRDPRIYAVVADISPAGAMERFAQEYPDRFINVGVAEQAMIGICAGLALRGCRPFAYTIAPFALYRPFEMVRDDLCYQNLPVTVVGMGAGVLYSTLGGTHHTMEDVAVASALPNMTVIAPCDPVEVVSAVGYCAKASSGPVYLRIGKAGEPILTPPLAPWRFGKLNYLRIMAEARVAIIAYGGIASYAIKLHEQLHVNQGIASSVFSCHMLKPLDLEGLTKVLLEHQTVMVMEEHVPQGGLLAQLKALAYDVKARCSIHSATLQDKFIHAYGSHADLLMQHGLI